MICPNCGAEYKNGTEHHCPPFGAVQVSSPMAQLTRRDLLALERWDSIDALGELTLDDVAEEAYRQADALIRAS